MPADEQDRVILNYAILNGALELLPDSLASMAIISLQMKMMYRIGKSYGFDLDRGTLGRMTHLPAGWGQSGNARVIQHSAFPLVR